MKKRLKQLLVVILSLICFACVFTACDGGSAPPQDNGGVETPGAGAGDESGGTENPDDSGGADTPGEPEDGGGENNGGAFQGNPPSNPNKEDVYDAN